MKEYLKREILGGKGYNLLVLLKLISFNLNLRFVFLVRLMYWLNNNKFHILESYLSRRIIVKYGCFIGSQSKIGIGVKFPHPNGIVIGANTIIGENCTIYQQVTFGGKIIGDAQEGNYPIVGKNVIIFSGAKLIGNVHIGDNVVIGANSVVNKDMPSHTVVAGVPAKVLKKINH